MTTYIDTNLLKEGDIILFHENGIKPIALGIRLLTGSYWNHVGMLVKENEIFYVIEALGRVVKTPLCNYIDKKNYDLKIVRLKEEAFKDKEDYKSGINIAILRLLKSIGTRYDYFAILYLGIKYTTSLIWKHLSKILPDKWNPFQQRSKFFCSELICSVCYKISSKFDYLFQGDRKQLCDSTTPKDIGKSKNVYYITGNESRL